MRWSYLAFEISEIEKEKLGFWTFNSEHSTSDCFTSWSPRRYLRLAQIINAHHLTDDLVVASWDQRRKINFWFCHILWSCLQESFRRRRFFLGAIWWMIAIFSRVCCCVKSDIRTMWSWTLNKFTGSMRNEWKKVFFSDSDRSRREDHFCLILSSSFSPFTLCCPTQWSPFLSARLCAATKSKSHSKWVVSKSWLGQIASDLLVRRSGWKPSRGSIWISEFNDLSARNLSFFKWREVAYLRWPSMKLSKRTTFYYLLVPSIISVLRLQP